jgi:hypothetical protein
MAKVLPNEANIIALRKGISFAIAPTKATSEEKGKIVAAKKAVKKSVNSAILYSQ